MRKRNTKREEKLKKEIKGNTRGITLVALVVTVIVLLILAGVSVGLIFDSEGLFSKANAAASKYNRAKDNEIEEMNKIGSWLNEIGNQPNEEEEDEQIKWLYEERVAGEYVITGIDFSDFTALPAKGDLSTTPKSVAVDEGYCDVINLRYRGIKISKYY